MRSTPACLTLNQRCLPRLVQAHQVAGGADRALFVAIDACLESNGAELDATVGGGGEATAVGAVELVT